MSYLSKNNPRISPSRQFYAHGRWSYPTCRSIYMINALLGAFGAKGGLQLTNKPADFGKTGLKKFMDLYPKPQQKRADGVGWKYPHFEEDPSLAHLLFILWNL